MKYTYLIINICTILIPLVFSFHPRINFYRTWRAFFPAVILAGLYFILWDVWFASMGVWGFNSQYLTGVVIGNLPLEEVMFFLCIPYACVFTFHCVTRHIPRWVSRQIDLPVTIGLIVLLVCTGIWFIDKIYTATTFLGLAAMLLLTRFVLNVKWLGEFYCVYAVLLIPFLVVNGILTGSGLEKPVVWYNDSETLSIRILTIPCEDIFYGMKLVLMNLLFFQHWISKNNLVTGVAPA